MTKENKLEKYAVRVLMVAVSGLLLLNVFLIYRNAQVIEKNLQQQEETEKVKVNTINIIRTIHHVDMGMRGYALVPHERHLVGVREGVRDLDTIFHALRVALSEQDYPMKSLRQLEDSTHIYMRTVTHMLDLLQAGQKEEFVSVLEKDLGYQTYLSFERFSRDVNTFEDGVAERARQRYNRALSSSYWLQVALFLITMPALLMMMHLLRKNARISRQLTEAERSKLDMLRKQKEELEREVIERTNDVVAKNREIVEAYETIGRQNEIIQEKNLQLMAEVAEQTKDLRRTNNELAEQNARHEQFAYILSHNLRAPMARLMGLAAVLRKTQDEAEKSEIVDLMVRSTEDFDDVFKDLALILGIQKSNADAYSPVSLDQVAKRTIKLLSDEISEAGVVLETDFSAAPVIQSLPQYIESIFYNLISNAIKYRCTDRTPSVSVKSRRINGSTQIIFTDNGLGIDLKRHKDSIFNLYKRFHFHVDGKGMGLYLVRTQVEALSGTIHIDSNPAVGSVFTITL